METIKDSTGKTYYRTVSGLCYIEGTDKNVMNAIDWLIPRGHRVRIWYGKNGKSWDEENDVTGYIGRSTGQIKIPLLVNNSRSLGGLALLTNSIVKIVDTKTKRILYVHPNFAQGKFDVHTPSDIENFEANVYRFMDNKRELYARCRKVNTAIRLAKFMNGERFSK